MTRKKNIKGENEKVITVSANRDFLSRLVIIAKARGVDLKGSLALSFLLFPLLSHIQMISDDKLCKNAKKCIQHYRCQLVKHQLPILLMEWDKSKPLTMVVQRHLVGLLRYITAK